MPTNDMQFLHPFYTLCLKILYKIIMALNLMWKCEILVIIDQIVYN